MLLLTTLSPSAIAFVYPCGTDTTTGYCAPGEEPAPSLTSKTTSTGATLVLTDEAETVACDNTGGTPCGTTGTASALTLCGSGAIDCDPNLEIRAQVEAAGASGATIKVATLSSSVLVGFIDSGGALNLYKRVSNGLGASWSIKFTLTAGTFTDWEVPRNDDADDGTDVIVMAVDAVGNLHNMKANLGTGAFTDWYAVSIAGDMFSLSDYYFAGPDQVIATGGLTPSGDAYLAEATGGAFTVSSFADSPDTGTQIGKGISPGTSADVAFLSIEAPGTVPTDIQTTATMVEFDPVHTIVWQDQMTGTGEDHIPEPGAVVNLGTTDFLIGMQFVTTGGEPQAEMGSWTAAGAFQDAKFADLDGFDDSCTGATPKPTGSRAIFLCESGGVDSATIYSVSDDLVTTSGVTLSSFNPSPGGAIDAGTLALVGEVISIVGENPNFGVFQLLDAATLNPLSKIIFQEDNLPTTAYSTAVMADFVYVGFKSGAGSTAEVTEYAPLTGNVPEFSLTTLLIAVLISGFVLMFVIRRKR